MSRCVLLSCLLLSACGEDAPILQPSNPQTKQAVAAPAPASGLAPLPPIETAGYDEVRPGVWRRVLECEAPCTLKVVFLIPHALTAFHFAQPFASHQDRRDGGTTISRPVQWLRVESGPTDYAVGQGGTTVLAFDTRQLLCGSVQLDQDLVDNATGKADTVWARIERAERDCEPGKPSCGTLHGFITLGPMTVDDKDWDVEHLHVYVWQPVTYMNVAAPAGVELWWKNTRTGAVGLKITGLVPVSCDDQWHDASFGFTGMDVDHRAKPDKHWKGGDATYTAVVKP